MRIGILAFSENGLRIGERLWAFFASRGDAAEVSRCREGMLKPWTSEHFHECDALVFVSSCGIAVRAVAPHMKSKTSDPAVIVVDELGTFAISLLSGHIGGANALAGEIATALSAVPVITTATDVNGVFAIDEWAARHELTITNPSRIKWTAVRLLAGETLHVKSAFPVEGAPPEGLMLTDDARDVVITYRTRGKADALRLVPRVVTVGIGCRKGTSAEAIEEAFNMALAKANCHPAAVKRICSIDLKAGEGGLLEFCRRRALPFRTFSAQELLRVEGKFTASEFVKSVTGVDNVCERSAVLGSGAGGKLLTKKDTGQGVTMALAIEPYTVRFDEVKVSDE